VISTKNRFGDYETTRRLRAFGTGYTWFVRVLRLALPLLALVLIGVIIARLMADPQKPALTTADLPQDEKTMAGHIEMVAAKYQGVDGEGRAYTVTADTASRDTQNTNAVLLENPTADLLMPNGDTLRLRADHGRYDTVTTDIRLQDNVVLTHGDGYEMQLRNIEGNVKARTAMTTEAVFLHGPAGKLAAAGMDIRDSGDMIVFQGPVALTLYNLGKKGPG
jgi:lipopolysaccharide export system protein LptC